MKNSRLIGIFRSKRIVILVAAVAVTCMLSSAKVYAEPIVDRYGGEDRYETAAEVCEAGWNTNTDNAVLVNGQNYPDALSAAPLAKKYDAPVLLTGPKVLNPYTSSELTALNVKNVFIVGGKAVVSQSIQDGLKARGIKVTRLGGTDRYDTAVQVAKKLGKSEEVALVNGNDFRDGMTMASIAALKGMPILPIDGQYMPDSVKKYLGNTSKMDQIYVVGDSSIISNNAIKGLSNVRRIGSGNVYKRNVDVIEAFQNEINTSTVYLASARDFPDSLTASAIAPKTSSPVLFIGNPMDEATSNFLSTHIINNLKILGGLGSISYESENLAKALPLDVDSAGNITDTIWQGDKYTPRATVVVTATDGSKKEVAVDWNLTDVNTSKPGTYVFTGILQGTDKTIYTTLIVKPVPYKISDLNETAVSREDYQLPATVSAQMSDGSTSQVPVSWDYGTQSSSKPGIYVFNGTVEKYNKKVKLTLTVTNTKEIETINNIKVTVNSKDNYKLPSYIPAIMTDGSTESVPVTWGPENQYSIGVYTYEGTVSGYDKSVYFMLIVTDEGGKDPNDPNYPDNPADTALELGELTPIVQGDSYPSTVIDPTTGKDEKVTWTKVTTIDSTYIDQDNVDNCRISEVTLEGTIGKDTKVKAEIGIIPKILGITTETNTSNTLIPVVLPINVDEVYDMDDLSDELRAIIIDPITGEKVQKEVTVLKWDPPYISVGNSQSYNVTAYINNYKNSSGTNTVNVTLQVMH